MNIGFDASRAFTDNRTGTENYSFQILKHLVQLDHTNNYYIYLRSGTPLKGQAFGNPAHNTRLVTIPLPRLWTQVGLAQQTFRDQLDILFIPAHTIPLVRRPGLKTVVTVHDLGAEYLPKTHQIKQRLYLNLMTHHQLKSATHIIAVSQATKNDLIKKVGIPKEKISVVYEGYNKELFKLIKPDTVNIILKQFGLEKDNYFLFVGTIQPRKNLERLIRAYAEYFKRTPNVIARSPSITLRTTKQSNNDKIKLVLAGGKGWLSDEIYKLPKKLGIENHVKFLGYVPDNKLPALYSGAKAFLFPSLFEGFGLPILEAMACGCSVLTSNISSMPEVTLMSSKGHPERAKRVEGSHAAILVDPYSTEEISKGISELSTNYELRTKLIKLGFEQVKKFSWEKAAKETLAVLKKFS